MTHRVLADQDNCPSPKPSCHAAPCEERLTHPKCCTTLGNMAASWSMDGYWYLQQGGHRGVVVGPAQSSQPCSPTKHHIAHPGLWHSKQVVALARTTSGHAKSPAKAPTPAGTARLLPAGLAHPRDTPQSVL